MLLAKCDFCGAIADVPRNCGSPKEWSNIRITVNSGTNFSYLVCPACTSNKNIPTWNEQRQKPPEELYNLIRDIAQKVFEELAP